MSEMSIQDRYDEVSAISGLSEEVIRRVYKATKQSLAQSLKAGERATLPGICTIVPEIRNRVDIGGESCTPYIKLKAKPSSALESELYRVKEFKEKDVESTGNVNKLNYSNSEVLTYGTKKAKVLTNQISALL